MKLVEHEPQLADIKDLICELHRSDRGVLERVREAQAELSASAPLIAFVHIQRTAGGTVRRVLDHAYSGVPVRDVGNYFRNPEAMAQRMGQFPKQGWARWRRRGGRVMVGHMPYGLYRKHAPPDTRYVTLLREPIDRVLSHYHALIRLSGGPRAATRPTAESLESALAEKRVPQLNNLATRYLCGDPSPLGELPTSALHDAKANLRRFTFVGLQERFDESMVLLQRTLARGWNHYLTEHIGLHRPDVDGIPEEQSALILEHNRLDAELYSFAQELFEERIATVGEEFPAEVETLRAASVAANQEAKRRALDWLERQLPIGCSKPKRLLMSDAKLAGIQMRALKRAANLVHVSTDRNAGGKVVWSRQPDGDHSS